MVLFSSGISNSLSTYIKRYIIPQYLTFDKAHQIDHVEKVIKESLKLAEYYDVNLHMVYAIAAYHDLGLCEGRQQHHFVSGKILLADKELRRWFTEEEIQIMKEAVEDHRASNKGIPRSIYGKIVAEADRVIDPHVTIRRTVQYGLANYPQLNKEQQYTRFLEHLANKYAEGGYLRLWIPESDNAKQLTELRKVIADEGRLRLVFHEIYAEESKSARD